ncbi:MAG: UDP-N-acetylmuramate:L-alanyl-gamma-D-glutamyl-meso-diaminopimelate ligase, partial [Gammaproteobacteria bacterium]
KSYVYLDNQLEWNLSGEHYIEHDTNKLCQRLINDLKSGDEVVIMSNGSFDGLHRQLIKRLKEKYEQ